MFLFLLRHVYKCMSEYKLIIILLNFTLGITKAFANKRELAYSDSAGIPSGVIAMWSGQSTNIPDGWVLCNGQNGTPNLTDKFIIGAGAKYSPGNTGGEETHKLTTREMPSHNHVITHTLKTSTAGNHTHGYIEPDSGPGGSNGWDMTDSRNSETDAAGSHSHDITGTITCASTGSGTAHNNMPPYYALCFVMKL